MQRSTWICSCLLMLTLFSGAPILAVAAPADATLVDEWASLPMPPAPVLKNVVLDSKTTALLILDIQTPLCTSARPRCSAEVPKMAELLLAARTRAMTVAYSITPTGTPADILAAVAPLPGDPVVQSGVDKFFGTELDKILKDRGIKTVVIVGTAANGAVLHTAVGASLRGMQVVLPVDGMGSADAFAEQYTAYHMLNSPGMRNKGTLTKISLISFK